MTDEDELTNEQDGISRAMNVGTMWLNPVFRFDNQSKRLFGKRGPRVSKLEAFWAIVCFLLVGGLLFGMFLITGGQGPFFILCSPVAIFFWSLIALIQGRKVANMSPLRRRTGEGTGVWVSIQLRRIIIKVSTYFTRPVMYSRVKSRAGMNDLSLQVVESVEWIGTARAPRMPFPGQNADLESVPVTLKPRGERVALPRKRIIT